MTSGGTFVPERLREAREAMREHGRTVSQQRFAQLLGVSPRSVERWEGDNSTPRTNTVARISQLTGKPLSFFYDAPGPQLSRAPLSIDEVLHLRVQEEIHRQLPRAIEAYLGSRPLEEAA